MNDKYQLLITPAPQVHCGLSTARIMWTVSLCLVPAGIWGVYIFGIDSLFVLIASLFASVMTELVINLLQKKYTVLDGSAFLTGLLIGYNMPPTVPLFIPILASIFAVAVVKHVFGGLGRNWMNPALAGRAFAMFSWTRQMTTWCPPRETFWGNLIQALHINLNQTSATFDAVSGATPLAQGPENFLAHGSYLDLFFGNIPGCLGEVSAFLLLAGTVYLFAKKIIDWQIPAAYLGTFGLLTFLFGGLPGGRGIFEGDVFFHLFAGGLVLGAFYMATDPVTSPLTGRGMLIFGAGAGILTFVIRFFGGLPEGVSLAILFMNITVPLIDKYTQPVKLGLIKEKP